MTGVFSWEISVRLADTCHPEWGYLHPHRVFAGNCAFSFLPLR